MSKVALLADIHLGVSGRRQDINWALRVVREYCKAADINVVIILGDLWHNREALGVDILQDVVDFFMAASALGQRWIAFPGNHDMFLRNSWDINSLRPLRNYLTVIDDVKLLLLDERRFWVLPFITYEKSYMKVVRRISARTEPGDVLLTHVGVKGATLNSCFLLKDWSTVSFEYAKFKAVYTGHFHLKQQLGAENTPPVYYPGSLIPFKFDEGDHPHGFYVYDLKTEEHKFVNIWKAGQRFLPGEVPPPQFHTFLDELLPNKTEVDVKGNIVRVALQREYTKDEIKEMKERLLGLGALAVRWWNMAQKLHKTVPLVTAEPSRNLFKAWLALDIKGAQGLDPVLLDRTHVDVTREGDELYTIEETET